MVLHVFVVLLVVCLLLSLALLWRLDWFPVLAPWEIRSKRERDWGRSPFMFLAHELRNEAVEELIPDLVGESRAELKVELMRDGRNNGMEGEKGRR